MFSCEDTHKGEAANTSSSVSARPVRDRTPTGHNSGDAIQEARDKSVRIDDTAVSYAANMLSSASARSVRDRTPTGRNSGDVMQTSYDGSLSVHKDTHIGEDACCLSSEIARPVRQRTPTSFVTDETSRLIGDDSTSVLITNHPNGRTVSSEGDVSIGESTAQASSFAHPVRERKPTRRVSGDAMLETSEKSVSLNGDVDGGNPANTVSSEDIRPERKRVPIGSIHTGTSEVVLDEPISLAKDYSARRVANASSTKAGKMIRGRTPTGTVHEEDVHADINHISDAAANHPKRKTVGFSDVVSLGASSSYAPSIAQSVRERRPAGHSGADATSVLSEKSLSFAGNTDTGEAASILTSAEARPARDRIEHDSQRISVTAKREPSASSPECRDCPRSEVDLLQGGHAHASRGSHVPVPRLCQMAGLAHSCSSTHRPPRTEKMWPFLADPAVLIAGRCWEIWENPIHFDVEPLPRPALSLDEGHHRTQHRTHKFKASKYPKRLTARPCTVASGGLHTALYVRPPSRALTATGTALVASSAAATSAIQWQQLLPYNSKLSAPRGVQHHAKQTQQTRGAGPPPGTVSAHLM
jgi:hypothetical protein